MQTDDDPDDLIDHADEPDREGPPQDPKVDEAKEELVKLFAENPNAVFYERQIVVRLEDQFYHWITARALHQMVDDREIDSEKLALFPGLVTGSSAVEIRAYWARRNRYWKREAERIRRFVMSFSTEQFGRALGRHGETMFDAALPKGGFRPVAENTNSFGGKVWTATRDNLDRIFEKDGVHYGTEIKNRLQYIEQEELRTKLSICKFLGLKPLFIMRHAPKSYNWEIIKQGGYVMIFKTQLYPHGYESLAREIGKGLGLPVACPAAVERGRVDGFAAWHEREKGAKAVNSSENSQGVGGK